MPWASTADLPPAVRDHIAEEAGRRLFLEVFASAWRRGCAEDSCFRQAWGALKRAGWRRGPDGVWRRRPRSFVPDPNEPELEP